MKSLDMNVILKSYYHSPTILEMGWIASQRVNNTNFIENLFLLIYKDSA